MKRLLVLLLGVCLLLPCPITLAETKPQSLSATCAIVMDATTKEVLFEKEIDRTCSMASTTKIMTTLLLLEQGNLDRTITVTKEMVGVEGTSMGLKEGDTITPLGLCYGMMLSSGNDAANAAAIAHSGSIAAFQNVMNQKAAALGMRNTHFVTPSGLDADTHYSTAYDMALLTAAALQNPTFCQIAQSKIATVAFGNPPTNHTLENHNRLLNEFEGCVGVKTGFTKKSGRCLVSAATRQGATLICVTLKAPDDWNDHKALLTYGFSLCEQVTAPSATVLLPLVGGKQDKTLVQHQSLSVAIPTAKKQSLTFRLVLPPFLYAPIQQNQPVGLFEAVYQGTVIAQVPIVALQKEVAVLPTLSFSQKFLRNFCRLFP